MRDAMVFRIRIITGLILMVALVLVGRLYYIQIIHNETYTERAERQYVQTTAGLYSRGNIYFTTKDNQPVAAASVRSGFTLAFNPRALVDPAQTCEKLLSHISISDERCRELATLDRSYVEVERMLDRERANAIRDLNLRGVQLPPSQWRYYPGQDSAARTIGFVGFTDRSDTDLHGKYGLERFYDNTLFASQEVRSVNIFAEIFSDLGQLVYRRDKEGYGHIHTTLEPTVTRMLDSVLATIQDQYQSELTGAIIMNPKTGAIYGLSVLPTFDLNQRGTTSIETFQNPLVENVYEFGSTIKALTIAAGLDSGAITRQSTYYDGGSITLDGFTIRNFDGKGRGTVDMQTVLNQSLNTGVSHIVNQMGKERFRDYFTNFRLGSETGIDLPNEAMGLVDNLRSPRDVEYATASFGQGIALSPIAVTRAFAALANGGYLVTPHLVSKIEYDDGTVQDRLYPIGEQVISTAASEEISRMLVNTVDTALLNGRMSLEHHTVGAKTGTAQMADPEAGGYYEDRFLHSFFGYFPAFDPQFLVFIYTVDPKGVRYASETLSVPFMDITKFLINYYNIPPDR